MARATKNPDEAILDGDPDEVLLCVMSYASDALPGLGVIREGTRFRRRHDAVAAYPRAWVPAGWTDDEIHAQKAELGALGTGRM
jgi:hypothetical protein